jgi:putative FmdB family regulatory protein
MPIYEYQCRECGLKFEELVNSKEESEVTTCRSCGSSASRIFSSFASAIAGGSGNESVDMRIGREANKRWQDYHDRQSKRRGNNELKSFDLPKTKDGKFMPVMGLGNKKEVADRHEYVGALQEHRKQRAAKGLSQFAEKGAF